MGKGDPIVSATPHLAVPDGGWGWVIVFCSFMIHFITVGTTFSLSVLFIAWVDEFETSRGLMSWVISVAAAVMFGIGPVPANLASRFGCRTVVIIGGIVASIGFVLGYFATNVYMLIVSIGLISGTGCGFCYLPAVAMVAQYFDKKRSVAVGIGTAGVGIGSFVMAPVFHILTTEYGWRGTLLINSGFFLNLVVFGLLMRPLEPSVEAEVICVEEIKDTESLLNKIQSTDLCNGAANSIPKILVDIEKSDITETGDTFTNTKGNDALKDESMPLVCTKKEDDADCLFAQNAPAGVTATSLSKINGTVVPNIHNSYALREFTTDSRAAGRSLQHLNVANDAFVRQFSSHHELRRRKHTGSLATLPENAHISRLDLLMSGSIHSLSAFKGHHFNYEGTDYYSDKHHHFSKHGLLGTDSKDSDTEDSSASQNSRRQSDSNIVTHYLRQFFSFFHGFYLLNDFVFLMFVVSNILTNLSYLMPVLFMVDRAVDNGIDYRSAAMLVSINGAGNVFGRIFFGFVADRNIMDRIWWYILCLTMCGLATCISPLCGSSVVMHGVFALSFGCFIGAYTTLAPVVTVDLVGVSVVGQAYGVVLLFMGIAGVIGPPVAGWVYDLTGDFTASFILHGAFIILSAVILVPVVFYQKWRIKKKSACKT